jgi:hypothetical protein
MVGVGLDAGVLLSTAGVDAAGPDDAAGALSAGAGAVTGGGVTRGASVLWASKGVDDRARTAAIAVMPGRSGDFMYLMYE